MNHCPVYCAIGGHAYGSVYPGPIGAVLTPALVGSGEAEHLAQASTFCGRCEEVCPVEIPLVSLMRGWREKDFAAPDERRSRALLRAWTFLARRPRAYRLAARLVAAGLARMAGATGRLARLPFGARWTRQRDFPAPEGRTFQDLWARRQRGGKRPMSRGEIFSAIRIALDASAGASAGAVRRRAAELRLATPGEHARPQIASLTGLPRLTRFQGVPRRAGR
ncbi:MAG: lactate utilization protein LutB domain-containing protein [Hyphomicrobium sp.]